MSDKYDVQEYTTASGKNKVDEFITDLYKKHLVNDALLAARFISDLKERGMHQSPPNEVKPLDKEKRIYEIKRKGKDVRLGLYVAKNDNGSIIVLGGFLKDSQKTRKADIDMLRKRQQDYISRNTKNGN